MRESNGKSRSGERDADAGVTECVGVAYPLCESIDGERDCSFCRTGSTSGESSWRGWMDGDHVGTEFACAQSMPLPS